MPPLPTIDVHMIGGTGARAPHPALSGPLPVITPPVPSGAGAVVLAGAPGNVVIVARSCRRSPRGRCGCGPIVRYRLLRLVAVCRRPESLDFQAAVTEGVVENQEAHNTMADYVFSDGPSISAVIAALADAFYEAAIDRHTEM